MSRVEGEDEEAEAMLRRGGGGGEVGGDDGDEVEDLALPPPRLIVSSPDDDAAIVGWRALLRCSPDCLRSMGRSGLARLKAWLLEVEMGVVWGVAGISIIVFVFLSIWFIDPALLTLVLQFRQARCVTEDAAYLVGISNCSWTSCRLGCTREIYKCWQVKVRFEFVRGTKPYKPPWSSLSSVGDGDGEEAGYDEYDDDDMESNQARLYPNVRGCGYPPELNCERFYDDFGPRARDSGGEFDCWVSTMDTGIAMTDLDLERAKTEVVLSLVPLFVFIVFVLYAFCRLGVFSVCNPLKLCPKANDTRLDMPSLTPKKLFDYKKSLIARKNQALASFHSPGGAGATGVLALSGATGVVTAGGTPGGHSGLEIPATIEENDDEEEEEDVAEESAAASSSRSSSDRQKKGSSNAEEGSSTGARSRKSSKGTSPAGSRGGSGVTFRRAVFSASSLVSLRSDGGGGGGGGGRGSTSLAVPRGDGSRRDSFDREMMDLKDFDSDVGAAAAAASDDVVSIRSVRQMSGRPESRGAWMAATTTTAGDGGGGKKDS